MPNFDSLNETFNTDADIVKVEPSVSEIQVAQKDSQDIQKDYEYSRAQLYSLIEKGQEAINGILEMAGEGGSARAYEVAFQGIKNIADVTDKLADLHKKLKEIEEDNNKTTNNVTNNALFVGSTDRTI